MDFFKNRLQPNKDALSHPCNKKQLADEMEISFSTFQRMLKKHNIEVPRGLISPEKKQEILNVLGWGKKA